MNTFNCPPDCDFSTNRTARHLLEHIRRKIPTVISDKEIDILPRRNDFLDTAVVNMIDGALQKRDPILFMPSDIRDAKPYEPYSMFMYGILPDGRKVRLRISGVKPSYDVMVPAGVDPAKFAARWRTSMQAASMNFIKPITHHAAKSLFGFHERPKNWIRVSFDKLTDYKQGLTLAASQNSLRRKDGLPDLILAGNDRNNYYRKIVRDWRFKTADWNRVENYDYDTHNVVDDCICLVVPLMSPDKNEDGGPTNIYRVSKERRAKYTGPMRQLIEKDKTMVAMWDIETYRDAQKNIVPTVNDTNWVIFMMCSAYFWHHSAESMLRVCCQIGQALPRPEIDVIIACQTEEQMLIADIEIKSRMRFDILGAFNGSCFDWPMVLEKLKRLRLLGYLRSRLSLAGEKLVDAETTTEKIEQNVIQWDFSSTEMKISAELTLHLRAVSNIPGWVDTDVMPTFMKLYTRMEVPRLASLNFFLKKNGIEAKADMPYTKMFRIYERSLDLAKAAQHCHCGTKPSNCFTCDDFDPEIDSAENSGCCYCVKRPENLRQMGDVAYYCTIDCVRPQQLYVTRNITFDKRELSSMSYVNLYDSFYRADGMKVRNLIGSYCTRYDIGFPAVAENKSNDEKIHYPGAHVFPPKRGFTDRPVTGLDFASLYPSLMMTYNLSPDMLVFDEAEANRLKEAGYSLHKIGPVQCEQGEKKGMPTNTPLTVSAWTVRHNGVIDRRETTTINGYERVEEVAGPDGKVTPVVTRKIGSDKVEELAPSDPKRPYSYRPVPGRERLPGERMGIFAYVVRKIFEKRSPLKKFRVELHKIIEKMKIDGVDTADVRGTQMSMSDVEFLVAKVQSKEQALKVLANTFYGETGNFRSSIYSVIIAAAITEAGQINIKAVHAFIAAMEVETGYGDTDSLYTLIAWSNYTDSIRRYEEECRRIYETRYSIEEARRRIVEPVRRPQYCRGGPDSSETDIIEEIRRRDLLAAKLKHWTELVQITMKVMTQVRNEVNEWLINNNGQRFLSMAYEEVGWPAVLCGKKKYFMMPHIDEINFYNEDIMIKGIDIVKQGKSELVKQIGLEVITEALAPERQRDLFEITCSKITRFYEVNWDLEMFVQMARYQPHKKNISVLTFVSRMEKMQERYSILAQNAPDDEARESAERAMELYAPPAAGDKFAYLMVEKDQQWMLDGKKITMKNGDYMEFVDVYKNTQDGPDPMRINRSYYMKGSTIGVLARFIVYHEKFQPENAPAHETMDDEEYKVLDEYCVKKASKFLENLADGISTENKTVVRDTGTKYRRVYSLANAMLRADLLARYGYAGAMLIDVIGHDSSKHVYRSSVKSTVEAFVETMVQPDDSVVKSYFTDEHIGKMSYLAHRRLWLGGSMNHYYLKRKRNHESRALNALREIYTRADDIVELAQSYGQAFVGYIDDIRAENAIAPSPDSDGVDPKIGPGLFVNDLRPDQEELMRWMADLICTAITERRLAMKVEAIGKAAEDVRKLEFEDDSE